MKRSGVRALACLRAEAAHHSILLLITGTYILAASLYLTSQGLFRSLLFGEYLLAMGVPVLALAVFRVSGEVVFHIFHVRPFRVSGMLTAIRQCDAFSTERASAAVVPVLLLPVFSSVFTLFKVSIPVLNPFSWDPVLMNLDQALHGGLHPWELLQPILGHPLVTSVISYLYNMWQGLLLIVYWQMFRLKERDLRMRFLLAFVLTWMVLGSGGAYLFSSAGPCYYGLVVDGPNPFAEQMSYLHASHDLYRNWSVIAQDYLWRLYTTDRAHLGGGISAMPSLHLAVAMVVFLLARTYSRRMGLLALIYVVIMMVGSVHLGWHYAIDGYVGILGGVVSWLVAGVLVRHVVPKAPQAVQPPLTPQ